MFSSAVLGIIVAFVLMGGVIYLIYRALRKEQHVVEEDYSPLGVSNVPEETEHFVPRLSDPYVSPERPRYQPASMLKAPASRLPARDYRLNRDVDDLPANLHIVAAADNWPTIGIMPEPPATVAPTLISDYQTPAIKDAGSNDSPVHAAPSYSGYSGSHSHDAASSFSSHDSGSSYSSSDSGSSFSSSDSGSSSSSSGC